MHCEAARGMSQLEERDLLEVEQDTVWSSKIGTSLVCQDIGDPKRDGIQSNETRSMCIQSHSDSW